MMPDVTRPRHRRNGRAVVAALGGAALLAWSGTGAGAQSAREGETLARSVCSPCHVVAGDEGGREGPRFADVAAMPSTTGLSLSVFLQSSHGKMPNILLSPDDIRNLAAYILSLKR